MIVLCLTSAAKLKNHPLYLSAKSGNHEAASRLAFDMVNSSLEKVDNFLKWLEPGTVLLPIHALEKNGYNGIAGAISLALEHRSQILGKESIVGEDIYQWNKVHHTGAGAIERLVNKPVFMGSVLPGKNYCVIDDVVTSGSTVNECRKYILDNGGRCDTSLCVSASFNPQTGYSGQITILPETESKILKKYDENELNEILNKYGIEKNWRRLTNSQASYLLNFRNALSLRARIAEKLGFKPKEGLQKPQRIRGVQV